MKRNLLLSIGAGLFLSLPITGFIYGFIICKDCKDGFLGIIERSVIGVIHAFLTTVTLGKPWDNEAGSSSTNIRIYVLLTFIIVTVMTFMILKFKKKK